MEFHYQQFISALNALTFSGEVNTDLATRLSLATDNSVYQILPAAVIFPKNTADIAMVLTLATQEKFKEIKFSPRGGGTGTNGQSLSSGIIIDCSKYMQEILEINLEQQWVRVQPGVVLDQLNVFLKTYDMHFAPEISPSNRATLGGMINTDACGNGSKVIGRTSDYVMDLTCVLPDGRILHTSEAPLDLQTQVTELIAPHQQLIKDTFIQRPRNLNGYNLLKTYQDKLNLNYLFSGSEGTLGIISEAKLKMTRLPKHKKLLLVKYKNFSDALRSHDLLDKIKPTVVEAIDEKLLALARSDPLYFQIADMLDKDVKAGAINLIEFFGSHEADLEEKIKQWCSDDSHAIGFYIANNDREIKLLWELRKKSVGLISKKQVGTRRPIPFIEDTAVPPEKLADYIAAFKQLLDQHQLEYGMYGHVDAGCVHVRPALDLKLSQDQHLFHQLSDQVVALLQKFGGVMWGEHGMGFRCQYAETFFGKELYLVIRKIKTLFDPHNKLNPGKIAVPLESQDTLVSLTGTLRASSDKKIAENLQSEYPDAMNCNGNGACFNYATADVMCPSYKVTKDRVHSPKGRAVAMREWLHNPEDNFSKEVYAAMNGCLSCKACATQCPLNVNVPDLKAKFLFNFHQKNTRPMRDYLFANIESLLPWQKRFRLLANWFFNRNIT